MTIFILTIHRFLQLDTRSKPNSSKYFELGCYVQGHMTSVTYQLHLPLLPNYTLQAVILLHNPPPRGVNTPPPFRDDTPLTQCNSFCFFNVL